MGIALSDSPQVLNLKYLDTRDGGVSSDLMHSGFPRVQTWLNFVRPGPLVGCAPLQSW
ncbi:hypothetical protein M378DRAFT_173957 [Amanita muscaria Koide BX008]|uniref:Uncharacterized protein n=1 Tax=Amanita muscaria (strain Koide BX008) TaxID=946122 RepID=A0A0C2WFJ2_AMAMK|nr:hypothetical protein M378DRAFT_173957 [Amanita muscaria Koide BX008]